MNILDTLKQLRDDIKTWVTNNLNALNAKIDEKTIPIDSELSSTSTNPVQNKVIKKAIDNIPKFSGDYNDLTNAPDITEDDSGNMIIADESGNIIFKADADGIYTTAVSIDGEAAATEKYVDEAVSNIDIPEVDFTGYATEDFVTNTVDSAKEELSESIVAESDEWKVVDEAGNIIFSVDAGGAHTTALSLNGEDAATESYVDNAIAAIPEVDFTGYATETYVNDAIDAIPKTDLTGYATEEFVTNAIEAIPETDLSGYYTKEETNTAINDAKEELSESIVADSEEWKVVDNNGNIIFSVDAEGAHTTALTLNGESVKSIATKEYVDEEIENINLVQIVNSLPEEGLPNQIYLVPSSEKFDNTYEEYVWVSTNDTLKMSQGDLVGTINSDYSEWVDTIEWISLDNNFTP